MDSDKNKELLDSTPMNRRSMLKRVLIGGAVVYSAPVVATFALNGTPAGAGIFGGSNQTFGDLDHDFDGFDWGDPFVEPTPTPEPTPDPTPTVAPTTAPKKYEKPKSSGGGAAPTFTG